MVAVDTPLEPLADKLFSAHMAQHLLLLVVAPPLIVLSAPWLRLWQPLPLGFRRAVAKSVARRTWAAPLRALARLLAGPWPAWALFCSVARRLACAGALRRDPQAQSIHDLEHATFVAAGLIFWLQVIDSPPVRTRLALGLRVVYLTTAMLLSWVLAIVIALASTPFYTPYVNLTHRPGGLSALADQQIAGGVMWVPGSVPFTIAIILAFYRWLDPGNDASALARRNGHGRLRAARNH